jgi:hypothetical protein
MCQRNSCGESSGHEMIFQVMENGTERATKNLARLQWQRVGGWVGPIVL